MMMMMMMMIIDDDDDAADVDADADDDDDDAAADDDDDGVIQCDDMSNDNLSFASSVKVFNCALCESRALGSRRGDGEDAGKHRPSAEAVSYTHLRAHETEADL
eukprot:3567444-Amphidinium_carterae.1